LKPTQLLGKILAQGENLKIPVEHFPDVAKFAGRVFQKRQSRRLEKISK
jgi:hypothetical protein